MNDVRFSQPVRLRLDPNGERNVATVWEALEILTQQWPEAARGRGYRAAWRACRDTLDGWKSPHTARRQFVHAARGAGLLVGTDPSRPSRITQRVPAARRSDRLSAVDRVSLT